MIYLQLCLCENIGAINDVPLYIGDMNISLEGVKTYATID